MSKGAAYIIVTIFTLVVSASLVLAPECAPAACEPSCGNEVVDDGEECELPNTEDNSYCSETVEDCVDNKLGVRDGLGNCNSDCMCEKDQFSYECVAGACGAECAVDADCDDGDPNTLDFCSDCLCVHEPVCGDHVIDPGEECELPYTFENADCGQSDWECSGNKLGTRDSFGDCNKNCLCEEDEFEYQCVKGKCDAECSADNDCDDGNPETVDSCTANCLCENIEEQQCGDKVVDSGEQCELPFTADNHHCYQSQLECDGNRLGIRDAYGDCDAFCGCAEDPYEYICIEDVCGAECDADNDCDDGNPHTQDYCSDACGCVYEPIPYCGDGTVKNEEECELPGTEDNQGCKQIMWECDGTRFGMRDEFGDCNSECGCTEDDYDYQCVAGQCGAECSEDADCDDGDPHTVDMCANDCMCHYEAEPYCGDEIVYGDEECELPGSEDNKNCEQSTTECDGHKLGTRDGLGSCDLDCGCAADDFDYECVKGECDAECDSDDDCQLDCSDLSGCVGNDYYEYHDIDSICLSSCVCEEDLMCKDVTIYENDERCIECHEDEECGDSGCEVLYEDYCEEHKLVEYDDDKLLDETVVTDDCSNSCSDYLCISCGPECPAPDTNVYCVNGVCDAECETDADCEDWDDKTIDLCLADCTCTHEPAPFCGDGKINLDEVCEHPETEDNENCGQSTEECLKHQLGTRDAFGDCDDACGCSYDDFVYACVEGECGAECDDDKDCGSNSCEKTFDDYCEGSKLVEYDDNKVKDSTTVKDECLNDCLDECLCDACEPSCEAPEPNTYCVAGECGAECSEDTDCDDGDPHTDDYCTEGCACVNEPIPYCGDEIVNLKEECELPDSQDNEYCPQAFSEDCADGKYAVRDEFSSCDKNCQCATDEFVYECVPGQCGAECSTDLDCDDDNPRTLDSCNGECGCEHECIPGTEYKENGIGVGICVTSEDFEPRIWLCDQRVVLDDSIEFGPGGPQSIIAERTNNYAFEGEQIKWYVLVMDKNGIDKIRDVFMTLGLGTHKGHPEVECVRDLNGFEVLPECNARIGEEEITKFDHQIMSYYSCTFTVETPASMYGQNFLTAQAEDIFGLIGRVDEQEFWFFNPMVGLRIQGTVDFGTVRPGTTAYADTILVGNDAEPDSGLIMNMFISGTDFYDAGPSGARCPWTNQLALKQFAYFATTGAYDTYGNPGSDAEGYDRLVYGDKIHQAESIIGGVPYPANSPFIHGNFLTPGSEMALTLRVDFPEPCVGTFTDGEIYFWGEAV